MIITGYKNDLLKDVSKHILNLKDDRRYSVEIKEKRHKRSLNSNSYCWYLIGEISDVLGASKDEIYLIMLKRYGYSFLLPVPIKEDAECYLKYFDYYGKNDKYIYYTVYKGSSEYDTYEMSIFLNGIVSECKEMGIETMTEDEIAHMNALWESERGGAK